MQPTNLFLPHYYWLFRGHVVPLFMQRDFNPHFEPSRLWDIFNHWVDMKAFHRGNCIIENEIIYPEAADRRYILIPNSIISNTQAVAHFVFGLYTCYGISLALKYPHFKSRLAVDD